MVWPDWQRGRTAETCVAGSACTLPATRSGDRATAYVLPPAGQRRDVQDTDSCLGLTSPMKRRTRQVALPPQRLHMIG